MRRLRSGSTCALAHRTVVVLVALLAACSTESPAPGGHASASAASGPGGELVVFAAASLTDAFTAVAADLADEHSAVEVKMNFAGSQSLRTQIENGAQPHVFASANAAHIDRLRAAELVDAPIDFAQNELVIVVPVGNPARVKQLADLPRATRLVLAGEVVPAGVYTERVLQSACAAYGADFADRVKRRVVSRETHVRQTLQKVVLGEADAAVVYATDARAAGDRVEVIAIPEEHNVVARYPLAAVVAAPRPELGRLFIDFVRSDAGRARLEEFGFRAVEAQGR